MGGSVAKTAVNDLSSTISTIASSTVQSCVVAATQTQSTAVVNTGFTLSSNVKLVQQTDISSTCFSNLALQTQLQNAIINAITQSTASNSIALIGAFGTSTASATANLTNIVRNSVTMKNIQTSYNSIKQNQSATFTNSGVILFQTASLTQGAQIFAAATLQAMDNAGIFNTVSNYVTAQSQATQTNPLQVFVSMISAIGTAISTNVFLFIFIIIAALVGGGYFMTKLGNSGVLEQAPAVLNAIPLPQTKALGAVSSIGNMGKAAPAASTPAHAPKSLPAIPGSVTSH